MATGEVRLDSRLRGHDVGRLLAARTRRIVKPWRIGFIAYVAGMTIGTHWPNMTFGPEVPASDKLIHMLAFAGLTILMWQTRWIMRLWLLTMVMIVWAMVDEFSQGMGFLNRAVTPHDMLANGLGVMTAVMWLWALGSPRFRKDIAGISGSRHRFRLHAFVLEEMFARRQPWLAAIGAAFCGMLVVLVSWLALSPPQRGAAVIVGCALAGLITLVMWHRMWQREVERTLSARPCLECGALRTSDHHSGVCEACGSALVVPREGSIGAPARRQLLHFTMRPALFVATLTLIMFGLILLAPLVYAYVLSSGGGGLAASGLARMIARFPAELSSTIDFAAYLMVLAVAVRAYRAGLARHYDQALACRQCGHDLRGTPIGEHGAGRCGECGVAFTRFS